MSIPYTYTIARVDADARCMEVVYQSPNRQEIRVSARIPFKGESLEAVIEQYSPVAYWASLEAELEVPQAGTQGSAGVAEQPVMTVEQARQQKLRELADWRYNREVSGVMVGGVRVATDRESQSKVASAFVSLTQGLATTVQWKAEGGNWVELDLDQMRVIAQAVFAHVQQSFNLEKLYADQVNAAAAAPDATVESILAIQPETVFQV